jgi:hypothetical protein
MPRFRILLGGSNIAVPGDVAGGAPFETVGGFFVTRIVDASSAEEAASRASAVVAGEWTSGKYAHLGALPELTVCEVHPVRFWERLRAKNTGYVFHPKS